MLQKADKLANSGNKLISVLTVYTSFTSQKTRTIRLLLFPNQAAAVSRHFLYLFFVLMWQNTFSRLAGKPQQRYFSIFLKYLFRCWGVSVPKGFISEHFLDMIINAQSSVGKYSSKILLVSFSFKQYWPEQGSAYYTCRSFQSNYIRLLTRIESERTIFIDHMSQ